MRKFNKVEKTMILMVGDNYNTYDCKEHGVFQKRKDVDDGKCSYSNCCENIYKIENIEELKSKFKNEFNNKK